jgi:hypothetical protein
LQAGVKIEHPDQSGEASIFGQQAMNTSHSTLDAYKKELLATLI